MHKNTSRYFIITSWLMYTAHITLSFNGPIITNLPPHMAGGILQLGNAVALYSLAKILSLKYNIPFVYSHFKYHDLFTLSSLEKSDLVMPIWNSNYIPILLANEDQIRQNLHKKNVIFITNLDTKIDYIDLQLIDILKKHVQLLSIPHTNKLPKNVPTIAVHIRKGNGGGEIYDGELTSLQEFEHNKKHIHYNFNFKNFPFDWYSYQRQNGYLIKNWAYEIEKEKQLGSHIINGNVFLDKIPQATYFPPNQFYIDQIRKISDDLNNQSLFVQLFTDDKNPQKLLNTIIQYVNKPNITFHYEDNRHLSHRDRILCDLSTMSQCDILIRSQSSFPRITELMTNYKMIIYPLKYRWEKNKLIMTEIVIS